MQTIQLTLGNMILNSTVLAVPAVSNRSVQTQIKTRTTYNQEFGEPYRGTTHVRDLARSLGADALHKYVKKAYPKGSYLYITNLYKVLQERTWLIWPRLFSCMCKLVYQLEGSNKDPLPFLILTTLTLHRLNLSDKEAVERMMQTTGGEMSGRDNDHEGVSWGTPEPGYISTWPGPM